MLYEGDLYRPPSESGTYILQATVGCSWNACSSCAMCRKNHALNYLPLEGRILRDRYRLVTILDAAIAGRVPLPPGRARGL